VRRRIAWCPQEAHLFDSTLRGNLRLAREGEDAPDDEEMVAALRRVGLGELLTGLPRGLDTPIGPGGAFLSGGQRQRVAVARTLLARADVVLLDEPTAHLDREAADTLMEDLRSALADRVLVVVTHDETIRRFDDVVLGLGEDPALVAA
jgi:ATP-binding cassette, subfamily C, bacterial CydCD